MEEDVCPEERINYEDLKPSSKMMNLIKRGCTLGLTGRGTKGNTKTIDQLEKLIIIGEMAANTQVK